MNKKSIAKVADIVRHNLGLTSPITLDKLVKSLKDNLVINCNAYEDLEVDATTSIEQKERLSIEIKYSNKKSEERKLFLIACEVGHIILHLFDEEGEIISTKDTSKPLQITPQELEANEFATTFLMPKNDFVEVSKEYTNGSIVDMRKIASYFNVPLQVATNRGNILGMCNV